MIKKIIKYNKIKNLINIKSFEVIMSIVGTVILLILLNYLNIYKEFYIYQEFIISFIKGSIFAFIGLIGFLISALSITVGMINKNVREEIIKLELREIVENDSIELIVYDFIFLGILISIEILIYVILLFLLVSNFELVRVSIFILLTILTSYLFLFTIFSSVSILEECYQIFLISINAEKNNKKRKELEELYKAVKQKYESEYGNHFENKDEDIKSNLIAFIVYIENITTNKTIKNLYYDCMEEDYEYEYELYHGEEESLAEFIKLNAKNAKKDLRDI